jgi:hypothetical protein
MPQPTAGDVHVNAPLTTISIAYFQEAEDFVARKVFPEVPVDKQSDRYYVYDRSFFYRNEMKKRAPGAESEGAGWEVDNTPNYFADVYALHKDIADQIRSNADPVINMDRDATEFLSLQALLNAEIQWASKYFTTGVWTGGTGGTDITPSTLWDASGGDPIGDIDLEKEVVKSQTGYTPNTLVLGAKTFRGIKNNADVIDRVKYTQKGVITLDMLAGLFDVARVMVCGGVQNSSAEGVTASYDFICGSNDALLVYAAPRPSLQLPSGGYTFSWTGYLGAGAAGQRIKRFRMEPNASDRVEIEHAFDQKLISSVMGAFFSNAVT